MTEEYNKRLQILTDKVNQVYKPIANTANTTSIDTPVIPPETIQHTSTKSQNPSGLKFKVSILLRKYIKYSYGIIPIIALVLYLIKPKFLLKKVKGQKSPVFDIVKFTFLLLGVFVLIYGMNFAVKKLI